MGNMLEKLKHPVATARAWLQQPQRNNRDALIVWAVTWVLGAVLTFIGLKLVIALLDLIAVIELTGSVEVWIVAALMAASLLLGVLAGSSSRPHPSRLEVLGREVESKTAQVEAYDLYTEHVVSCLQEIRLILRGELPGATYQELVELGVFEPANRLLSGGGQRGECRFSVLEERNGCFYMSDADSRLYPALNHRLASRHKFKMRVEESFSRFAYRDGVPAWSADVDDDERWEKHPKAEKGRAYKSIITVPLRRRSGVIYGVFNVISTEPAAFDEIDRNYLAVLGAVMDVARAVYVPPARESRKRAQSTEENPSS